MLSYSYQYFFSSKSDQLVKTKGILGSVLLLFNGNYMAANSAASSISTATILDTPASCMVTPNS